MTISAFIAFLILYSGPGVLGVAIGIVGRKIMDYTARRKPQDCLPITPLVILLGTLTGALFGPLAAIAGVLAFGIAFITLILSPRWWTEPIGSNGKHIPK